MGIFGRKKNETVEPVEDTEPVVPEGEPGVDRAWERVHDGPFDIAERDSLKGRLDLGALRVPAIPGMEMRLDVDKKSSQIVGLTCTIQGSKLQLQAFAAPRSEGLWDEIRKGLAEGISGSGGASQIDPDGVMGKELVARMRTQDANGRVATVHNRFIGVDGPRWFLRAVINGPAVTDAAQLAIVRKFLRAVVVDRGADPRPPREVLTLTAPKGVIEEATKRRAAERAAAAAKGVAAATGTGGAAAAAGAGMSGTSPAAAQADPAGSTATTGPVVGDDAGQSPDNGTAAED